MMRMERHAGWGFIDERVFLMRLQELLSEAKYAAAKSVTGPGRSGAVAAVYASHWLGVPFIPHCRAVPAHLRPLLVIDTAALTGATLRKAMRRARTELGVAMFSEPPLVRFWYEVNRGLDNGRL